MDVCVGRQEIFDCRQNVIGYEVLFRTSSGATSAIIADSVGATTQVIANSLLAIGLDKVVSGKRAFINFDRELLLSGWVTMLPPEKVVIELLETVAPDAEVIKRCQELRSQGYSLALDDYTGRADLDALVENVDILKVDFFATTKPDQQKILQRYKKKITVLAEKVEDQNAFDFAREMGCSLFQGYFFAKPTIVAGKHLPPGSVAAIALLRELRLPELNLRAIENSIREDVGLTYALLKYINSALFSWRMRVETINRALCLLSERDVRRWIALITLNRLGAGKPRALIERALLRGRFCELLAAELGFPNTEAAFLVGVVSLMDAIVNRPLAEIVGELGLCDELRSVLLRDERCSSLLGHVMSVVERYEQMSWDDQGQLTDRIGISLEKVGRLYFDAIAWTDELSDKAS